MLFILNIIFVFFLEARPFIKVLAIVGNTPITNIDLDEFRARLKAREKTLRIKSSKNPLEELIEEKILEKYTREKLWYPDEKEIDKFIENRTRKLHLTHGSFLKYIRENGYTEESFREDLKIQKAKTTLIERELKSRISISKEELKEAFKKFSSEPIETVSYTLKMHSYPLPCQDSYDLSKLEAISFLETELQAWLKQKLRSLNIDEKLSIKHNGECVTIKLLKRISIENPMFTKLKEKISQKLLMEKLDKEFNNWIKKKKKAYFVKVY